MKSIAEEAFNHIFGKKRRARRVGGSDTDWARALDGLSPEARARAIDHVAAQFSGGPLGAHVAALVRDLLAELE